ncbi:MAG: sulfatase-like hydrolase/transferase, partial [Holophagales bacterium]|nr:sulfatase-like hydrolase/transferase [Holophagales bacterium]
MTFDTTRADHLGPYGDASAHTPALDRLAAEGTVFEHCKSAAPITVPSHATILTGTYPNVHGVRDNGIYILSDERTTLAEILQPAGWRTAAAISSYVLDARFGTAQGFELYDDDVTADSESFWGVRTAEKSALFFDERPGQRTIDAVLPWLRARSAAGERFFLWVHLWSPHHPHIPPPPWNELFATDLYRGEIAAADAALGRLEVDKKGLDALDRRYLVCIARDYAGGPVGVETLATALAEQRDALEEVIEPYLVQQGLLQRTPRGRMLTGNGYAYLGLPVPA